MSKQLSVILKAIDQATAPSRAVANSLLGIGAAGIKADKLVRDAFGGVNKTLSQFKAIAVGAFAIFATSRLVGSIQHTTEELDNLGKAARRYGVSVEDLSALKYGADLANVSFETLVQAVGTAQKNLGQFAATGGGKAAPAIRALGMNVLDAKGQVKSMSDLLPEFADRFRDMTDAQREFSAQKIFGTSGGELGFFLSEGADRLRDYAAEAKRLGVVFSEDLTTKAEEYRDSLTRLGYAWVGLKAILIGQVAPALTETINKMAGVMAAVPDMGRALAGTVAEAFGGGTAQAEARERLGRLLGSMLDLVRTAAVGAIRLVLPLLKQGWSEIAAALDFDIGIWFKSLLQKIPLWVGQGYAEAQAALSESILPKMLADRDRRIANEKIESLQTWIDDIDRAGKMAAQSASSRDSALKASLGGSDYPEFQKILRSVTDDVAAQSAAFADAADNVIKWRDAIGAHGGMGVLPERSKRSGEENANAPDTWNNFKSGVSGGMQELVTQAKNYAEQGRQLILGIASSLQNNLSTAIYNVIAGVENLKDAFRNFAQQTLSQVSQLIIQMLVLRAIGGLAGAYLGGSGTISGTTIPDVAGSVPAYAAKGGLAWAGGVQHFDRGGFVHGPDVRRDMIPAMLMPGEFVMSRRGVESAGVGALAAINRGNGGAAGGGGGGVSVNVVINMQGGGGSAQGSEERLRRAARDGVLDGLVEALRRNPAGRESLRRALS